jgi:hypothetical protein
MPWNHKTRSLVENYTEPLLADDTAAILAIRGIHAPADLDPGQRPDVLVADVQHAADSIALHRVPPLVLANADDPIHWFGC